MSGSLLINEERLQSLTDRISDSVLIVQDYSIVHANRASVHMHGYIAESEAEARDRQGEDDDVEDERA